MTAPPSPDAVRLSNGVVEIDVPRAYGPRITRYGFIGEPNMLGDAPSAQRETPHGIWRAYGGHRLWAAPERFPDTYTIDDRPPEIVMPAERRAVVRRARDPLTGLVATIDAEIEPEGTGVLVRHVIANESDAPRRLAPWALTIVPPDGVAAIPNAVYRSQPEALLPARTITLWHYTDLSDARIWPGSHFLRMWCNPAWPEPTKIGVANERGWLAYVVHGNAFVKQTAYDPAAEYPDKGCSAEVYIDGPFCEVETLGPLVTLAPGASARHDERWSLLRDVDPQSDASLSYDLGTLLTT